MADPRQGTGLQFGTQTSAFPTIAGSFGHFHTPPESFEFPTHEYDGYQPQSAHLNPFEYDDAVLGQSYQEGGGSMSVGLHQGIEDGEPPVAAFIECGGCNNSYNTGNETITYTSTTSFAVTSDSKEGEGGILELNNGLFWPVLTAGYNSGAIIPSMALPSASSTGKSWYRAHTITPMSAEVARWAWFRRQTRTTRDANYLQETWGPCILQSVGEITIDPSSFDPLQLELTWHTTLASKADAALTAESFVDTQRQLPINGDDMRVGYGTANASGGVADGCLAAEMVKINLGLNTIVRKGIGCSASCADGAAGGILELGDVFVTLQVPYSDDYEDDWQKTVVAGTDQPEKYIEIVNPGHGQLDPAWGFFFPRCVLAQAPRTIHYEGSQKLSEVVYRALPSNYNTIGTPGENVSDVPWYLVVAQYYTP